MSTLYHRHLLFLLMVPRILPLPLFRRSPFSRKKKAASHGIDNLAFLLVSKALLKRLRPTYII